MKESHHPVERSANLASYIQEKRAAFEATPRKGIPRDQQRPISYEKYSAELFMLLRGNWRCATLKDVAKLAGTSYGLVRKWTAEKDFKEGVQRLANQYLDGFFKAFVEVLKELYATEALIVKKDNRVRAHEAEKALAIVRLIEAADNSWGWVIQQGAHMRIEALIKSNELSRKSNPEAASPDDYRYDHDRPRHHGAGFLRLLDLACHIRSKGRLKVDPGFTIRCKKELTTAIADLRYDLCIASEAQQTETVKIYSEALAYLSILLVNKVCQQVAEQEKQKGAFETWELPMLDTPRGMDVYR